MKDLSIIIVNYRTYQLTRQTLESVLEKDHPFDYQIYLVDDHSGDGSLEKLQQEFQGMELITFIASPENRGFAHANNLALEQINSRYVLLLNSDTQIIGDCLEKCLEYMAKDPEVGVLGCKVLLPDGRLDLACRRSFPTFSVSFYRMTGLSKLFPHSRRFGQYNLTYLDEDETYPVDCVVGAFMMVRWITIHEVGLLDEDFFMYGEDIDWCYRIKSAGWKIIYYSPAQILHHKGVLPAERVEALHVDGVVQRLAVAAEADGVEDVAGAGQHGARAPVGVALDPVLVAAAGGDGVLHMNDEPPEAAGGHHALAQKRGDDEMRVDHVVVAAEPRRKTQGDGRVPPEGRKVRGGEARVGKGLRQQPRPEEGHHVHLEPVAGQAADPLQQGGLRPAAVQAVHHLKHANRTLRIHGSP